ncbi:hypothetical protein GUJ93_ZPchr0015g6730 [Zizania palustris]|uniref:Uncharacterized protein n=1 Tax=Zizania palustris TaxID=103762 RepID=A0A8J5TI41_ZIZPA|nr:hypothetical protein GUJ93_ZPchr0015g6730 [Zizania palustris]
MEGGAAGGKGDAATGQTLAKLPLSWAVGDADMELSAVKKQLRVEPLHAVTPSTPEPLKVTACSFYGSTDGDTTDPTPWPLPPPTDPALQQ